MDILEVLKEILKIFPHSFIIFDNRSKKVIYIKNKSFLDKDEILDFSSFILKESISSNKKSCVIKFKAKFFQCYFKNLYDYLIVYFEELKEDKRNISYFYFYETIFNNINEGIHILNEQEETFFANFTALKLTGYTFFDIIGEKINLITHLKSQDSDLYKKIKKFIENGKVWEGEVWFKNNKSKIFPVKCKFLYFENSYENKKYLVEIFQDISELKKHKQYNEYLKYYDEVLDIPNKNFLKKRFKEIENCTGFLISIENYPKIIGLYDISIGEKFLKKLTKIFLKLEKRFKGRFFYLEGNLFIFLMYSLKDRNINNFLNSLFKNANIALKVNDYRFFPELTVGILKNEKKESFITFLNKLYIANEHARKNKFRWSFYKEEFKNQIITKFKIERLIKEALKEDKFLLFYQPKVNILTNKITGAEALIRMLGKDGEIISPGLFIPIAEESNLIVEIGYWVIERLFKDVKYINSKINEKIKFSFNISINHFAKGDFVDRIKDLIEKHVNEMENFEMEIEITEWAMMRDRENSIKKMYKLKELGFKLIIDDFGTGYSSLGYLKNFPIDYIKIDKSFTDEILKDEKTEKIVSSIIYLAKQLNLGITVEGVETKEQIEWFKKNNCYEFQGYYFSEPLPIENFITYVKNFKVHF